LFASVADCDAAGRPLGSSTRVRVEVGYDWRSRRVIVSERLRDDSCALRDLVVIIDGDGRRHVIADGEGGRSHVRAHDDVVVYADYDFSYEGFADDSGTNVP
jgi:YD repeat-containing protein